jgi:hypothetical protein
MNENVFPFKNKRNTPDIQQTVFLRLKTDGVKRAFAGREKSWGRRLVWQMQAHEIDNR